MAFLFVVCHRLRASAICSLLFVFPVTLSPMLNVALIGTGFIGSVHAANVERHPEINLAAIHDVELSRASQIVAQTGAEVAQDVEEIFAAKDIDVVLTPHDGFGRRWVGRNSPV
jgi:hypothetical protein